MFCDMFGFVDHLEAAASGHIDVPCHAWGLQVGEKISGRKKPP